MYHPEFACYSIQDNNAQYVDDNTPCGDGYTEMTQQLVWRLIDQYKTYISNMVMNLRVEMDVLK